MGERHVKICHDCASAADMDHIFLSAPWGRDVCEFCRKRKPCVLMDAGLKGRVEKALHDREEPSSEEAEGKNV